MGYTMLDIIKWATDHGMSLEQILDEARRLPTIMTNLQASRYLSAAGMIVVLYDTILTMPDEFRFIWPMSFGVIKAIWFLSRYVVPGLIVFYNYQFFQARPAMSDEFCQVYISGLSWCLNISFAASNWLLLLRVSALWGRKRAVIWPLYFCYFALYVVISVIVGLAVARMSKRLAYNPVIQACMFTERIPANLIHSQWLPIVFDVVIFILTLVKAKQDNIALRKGSRGNAPVLFILFRDGGIYCVVIIALRIFNFVAWAFLDESMVYLAMGFLWAIVTALINRFYLNLRRVAYATAAALLTNGSIRERPIAPGSGRLRELIEGAEMARRGAQSPWDYLDDDNLPVIDVVRQVDVDEMAMADLDRQRAQSVLGQNPNSPQSPQDRWRSTTPHPLPIYEGHGVEEEAVLPPQGGILIQQGVTVTY